jgi:hypothetical protein
MATAFYAMLYPSTTRRTTMPSNTKITEMKRKRKKANLGKKRKKMESKQSTPPFAIHPDKDA